MKSDVYLSVIIPAYNEEERIKDTIMDIVRYLSKQDYTYELVVVNDGSKDNTVNVLKELESAIYNLKFIDNGKNQGKGAVVKQGMLSARGKYRLYADADNAISINHIEKFWPYVKQGYDVIIGSIELSGSVQKERYTGFSKIYRNILGKQIGRAHV